MKKALIYVGLYCVSFGFIISMFLVPKQSVVYIPWITDSILFFSFLFLTKYFIYMFLSPWYDTSIAIQKLKYRKHITSYQPRVSVIVPAWNEEVGLIHTVESLLKSSYPNLEIVVINDGSTDSSDTLMRDFVAQHTYQSENTKKLVYHYKENGGKGSALNKGIEISSGEIILTVDADGIVDTDAVKNFVAYFSNPKVMGAVGNVKVANTDSMIGVTQYLEFIFSFYFKKADALIGSIYIIGGAAGAFRREVFNILGPYSEGNITEDIELTVRMQKAGMKIIFASDAIVYTEGANDIKSLMKQRLRWKRGRIDTFVEHKNLFFSTEKKHNKILSWMVMPFAVLGDTQLVFEIPFIIFLYTVAFITHDATPFIASIGIVSFVFLVQMFSNDRRYNKISPYILMPIGWLMFYLITIVEVQALSKSIWGIYHHKELHWQRWERKGIGQGNVHK
ncbi:MAG: Glycosyl transferase family 2 [Parcubacteria group bacterium GW2011_GWC1_39_29]|nr:MAG: Glycosyl transferase family 2 [Parcubacteria group bacterium GW2011_GWC1_39_29]